MNEDLSDFSARIYGDTAVLTLTMERDTAPGVGRSLSLFPWTKNMPCLPPPDSTEDRSNFRGLVVDDCGNTLTFFPSSKPCVLFMVVSDVCSCSAGASTAERLMSMIALAETPPRGKALVAAAVLGGSGAMDEFVFYFASPLPPGTAAATTT